MSTSEAIDRREALRRVGGLLGGAVSAPVVSAVLSGCERMSGPDWSPQVLTGDQSEMVARIAEIIIPPTDTPGARAANVNRFVDTLLDGSFRPDERDQFLSGLDAVNTRCQNTYDARFTACSSENQRALVAELDDETFGPKADPSDPENPEFYRMMKELAIVGYYTSEIGATQELKTNLVPGSYDGDVDYEEVGRAWA